MLKPASKAEVRRGRYKVAVDAEEGRRRREDNMVEIRKSRREESLQKKRREGFQNNQQFALPQDNSSVDRKVCLSNRMSIFSSRVYLDCDSFVKSFCFV